MLFCFFWHMPTWVAADTVLSPHFSWLGVSAIRCNASSFQQWNHFARTRMVVPNFAQGSPRVSWAYGTFACRLWWKHASRMQKIMVYDVPIILGHIYHQIHQSNITFCVFAFLSMNLTSTLGKVTSGPPETLFGGLVPTHWQSGVLAGLPRAVWACSGAENDRFRPCSTNKLRLFLGGGYWLPIQDPDPCWCLLMFVVGYLVTFRLTVLPEMMIRINFCICELGWIQQQNMILTG